MKVKKILLRCLSVLACAAAVFAVVAVAQFYHRSDPKNLKRYDTDNIFITGTTEVAAHRSGAGDFPEETLAAFRGCVEDSAIYVDYFEFDLHMTADNIPVLAHDDTLDRVSDSALVFGEENITIHDKTLAELKQLNMAAQFVNDSGEMPYADLHGDAVPNDLRILSLNEVFDYLTSAGDFRYIIELKDDGETGASAADQLYTVLSERELLDKVIIGTFHDDVAEYLTENYPDIHRSASTKEVLDFYLAAMTGKKDFQCPYDVLQFPIDPKESDYVNLGIVKIINYAHEHNLAIQYWTVNSKEDMKYLLSLDVDALMTDYPDRANALIG